MITRLTPLGGFFLALALFTAVATAEAAEGGTGFVRTEGTGLVGPDGKPFVIRSIGFGNWMLPEGYMFKFKVMRSPREIEQVISYLVGPEEADNFWAAFRENYIAEDDIKFIKAAGFTTVRIPLHWKLLVDPKDPQKFDGPGWAMLDRVIGWCREAGLKAVVDLHAAPGGQTGVNHDDGVGYPMTFYVPAHRRLTIALWQEIARRYRDEPAILGWEFLNEPISPFHDTNYLNPGLEPFYRQIAAAVRAVDKNHVIILSGAQWSANFGVFERPFDDNVMYTFHMFWADPKRHSVQDYVDFGNRWQVPIFLGETGEFTDAWNAAFRRVNEEAGIGWSFWAYKNLDTGSTVASINKPEGWDKIAAFGSTTPDRWPSLPRPSPEEAKRILDAYLEGAKFANTTIRRSYVASLGMMVPGDSAPVTASQ